MEKEYLSKSKATILIVYDYLKETYNYPASSLTGKRQEVGEICDFSSYGIDDNGMPIPTLIGPGMGLISAANNWDKNYFKIYNEADDQPGVPDDENPYKSFDSLISSVEKNGRTNWYLLEQGTSMSTPHAAGIVALWMQANPQLTTNDIIEILRETCRNDKFTTDTEFIPSHNPVQAIDAIEAGGHREATPATMYSIDAPVYNMMGQRIDKNTRGLVVYKGRKYVNQ